MFPAAGTEAAEAGVNGAPDRGAGARVHADRCRHRRAFSGPLTRHAHSSPIFATAVPKLMPTIVVTPLSREEVSSLISGDNRLCAMRRTFSFWKTIEILPMC